jgi:hypothetical protein
VGYVRLCPRHRVALSEKLRCPRQHQCEAWLVVEVATGRLIGAGRDDAILLLRPFAFELPEGSV